MEDLEYDEFKSVKNGMSTEKRQRKTLSEESKWFLRNLQAAILTCSLQRRLATHISVDYKLLAIFCKVFLASPDVTCYKYVAKGKLNVAPLRYQSY